jgi:hypothetical protein
MAKERNRTIDRILVAAALATGAKEGTRRAVSAESLMRGLMPHRWRGLERPPLLPEIIGRLRALSQGGLLDPLPDGHHFQVTDDGERAFISFVRHGQEV